MEKWPIACCSRDCSASSSNSFAGNRGFPRGSLTARACNGTRESESGDNVKLRKGGDSLIRINWNPSSIIIWRARRPSRRLCHLRKPLVPWVLRNRHPLHLMRKAVQWDRRSIILTVQRRVIKVAHRYHQEDHLCRNRHNSLHLSNRIIRLIHSRCHLIWVRRIKVQLGRYLLLSRVPEDQWCPAKWVRPDHKADRT